MALKIYIFNSSMGEKGVWVVHRIKSIWTYLWISQAVLVVKNQSANLNISSFFLWLIFPFLVCLLLSIQRELAPLNPTEVFYPQVLSDFYPLLKKNQNFSTSFRQSLAQDTKIPVVSKFSYTLFLWNTLISLCVINIF